MWAIVLAAVTVVQSSTSGSGLVVNTQSQSCSKNESYWVSYWDEAQYAQSSAYPVTGLCVPIAAGNLVTHLAAKSDENVAYPFNYNLDKLNSATTPYEYDIRTTPWQDSTEYHLGGQMFIQITGGAERYDLDLRALMKWTGNEGTLIENARTGLQKYLDNTKRLGNVRVVGVNRSQGVHDFDFLTGFQPPYLLHIAPDCIEENDYLAPNPAATLKKVADPLANFDGSKLGHTIAVYGQTKSGSTLDLTGASGLNRSRTNNERGCDATTTTVVADQTCVVGITYIAPITAPVDDNDELSTGAIVGIVVGAVGVLALAVAYYCVKKHGVVKAMYTQFI